MKLLKVFVPLVSALMVSACNTSQPIPDQHVLGILDVTLDLRDETAKANFTPMPKPQNQTRTMTTNSSETTQIALRRRNVSFIDDNESFGTKTRYVRVTFDFANFGPRAFNNLNFMAADFGSVIGTTFSSLADGSGTTIASTNTLPDGQLTYRGVKPAHGMRIGTDGNIEVDPGAADMQIFTPAEAASVETALSPIYTQFPLHVLQYGYTARKLGSSTTRSIPVTPTSVDCSSTLSTPPTGFTFVINNTSCLTGRVTFAFKFARNATRNLNPFTFNFRFAVSDETNPTTTQSLDEQDFIKQVSLEQALNLLPAGNTRKIRTLAGSGFFGYPNPTTVGVQRELLCNVKTAVATAVPVLANDFLTTKLGLTNFLPAPNTINNGTPSPLVATFCDPMNLPTSSSLVVNSSQTGRQTSNDGSFTNPGGTSLAYTPNTAFRFGEELEISLTNGITRASDGATFNPVVYRLKTISNLESATGFLAKTDFTTGSLPGDVASGDFNNDGKLDLATADVGLNKVSLLLGGAAGTFGVNTDFTSGLGPTGLATGDYNGDGNLDLAVTNNGSNTISILLGTGTGSLNPKTDFATGTSPKRIATGDFNGDGNLDLAVTNNTANTVSVLLGTNTGVFGTKTDFAVSTTPLGVTVGDFNNDGKLDLAVTNNLSNPPTISVLLGTGTGTFGAKTDFVAGNTPQGIAVGDFNNDQKLDLAFTNINGATESVSVMLGTGIGTFNPKTDFTVGAQARSVAVSDVNGDGNSDLIVPNTGVNAISVLLGTGTGTFGAKTDFTTAGGPQGITIGDFNNDGRLDMATASTSVTSNVSVLLKK